MGKIRDDLKHGKRAERRVHKILETKFGELTHDPDQFANFDFYNDKFCVEHKQRNINHDQYGDLFLERAKYDKYLKLREEGKRCFIVWSCLDGMYVWEFEDQFRGDDAVFYDETERINRKTHIQSSVVSHVFIEYIKKFDALVI